MSGTAAPNVLIVDDRPDNLLALEAILEPLRCRTVRASSGEEALRYLLKEDVAVILLDVQMPGIDGYETAQAIKGRDRTRSIPIIFLSAIDREIHHQLRGYSSGAVDFLPKPLQPEVLVAKVAVFLDLHEQARTIATQAAELAQRLDERDTANRSLQQVSDELQRSNGDLERFALVAAHDLLEPLQVGRGLLELLEGRHAEGLGDEGVDLARQAAASIDGMAELVTALLAYAKAGTAGVRRPSRPVDLERALEEALTQLAGEIGGRDAQITHDPLPTVHSDPYVVTEVLVQVLRSALDRHDGSPRIHVGLSRREDRWVVSIVDDGPTIPATQLTNLFTLFAPSDDRAGGIVLALSRRLLDGIGEEIWAEASPVRGTTTCFTLSVAAPER